MPFQNNQKQIYSTEGWLKVERLLSLKEVRSVKQKINFFLKKII